MMKQTMSVPLSACLVALALLFVSSCENLMAVKPRPDAQSASAESNAVAHKGFANIALFGAEERSVGMQMPVTDQVIYILTFESEGKDPLVKNMLGSGAAIRYELEPGDWTVTVEGYLPEDGDHAIVTGTAAFTVVAGQAATDVSVPLSPSADSAGTGTLEYSVSFPPGLSASTLRVIPIPVTETNAIRTIELTGSPGTFDLPGGYYRVAVYLNRTETEENIAQTAGETGIVQIYSGLTTRVEYAFAAEDFSTLQHTFTSMEDLSEYLAATEPNTVDNPYVVALSVDLESDLAINGPRETPATVDYLGKLLTTDALNRYIALDLSGSTGGNKAFSTPGSSATSGNFASRRPQQNYIVSIILPSDLTEITGYHLFYQWANLGSIDFSRASGLTGLTSNTFNGCSALTSIQFPPNLETLATGSFTGCASLVSVDLSATKLKTIVGSATGGIFANCASLVSVKFPPTLESLGSYTFRDCASLVSVDLSATQITSLGANIFNGCAALTSVQLPATMETIGTGAFQGCASLKEMDLSFFLMTTIPSNLFSGCTALESVALPDEITSISDNAFMNCESLVSVNLPATGLTSIGNNAFMGCSSLTSASIGATASASPLDSVTVYGYSAFVDCASLDAKIKISDSLNLGGGAFAGSPLLTFEPAVGSSYGVSEDGKFLYRQDGDDKILVAFPMTGEVTIPEGVTGIAATNVGTAYSSPFSRTSITSVTIPESMTKIPAGAFQASALVSVTLPRTLIEIGDRAFENCSALATVNFEDITKVTSIGGSAFATTKLAEVDLSGIEDLTSFGTHVFFRCTSLVTADISSVKQTTLANTFSGCTALESVTLPSGLLEMGISLFDHCEKLTSLEIPQNLQKITGSFTNCLLFTTLEFPSTLTEISTNSFTGCTSLLKLVFHSTSVIKLGTNAATGATAFGNPPPENLIILVPAASLDAYRAADGWSSDNLKNKVAGVYF